MLEQNKESLQEFTQTYWYILKKWKAYEVLDMTVEEAFDELNYIAYHAMVINTSLQRKILELIHDVVLNATEPEENANAN